MTKIKQVGFKKIMKFGGTSVGSPDAIKIIGRIVRAAAKEKKVAVVVSAFAGVTDALLECAHLAESAAPNVLEKLDELKTRHLFTVQNLVQDDKKQREEIFFIKRVFMDLARQLQKVARSRKAGSQALDAIACTGEILSAHIVAAHIGGTFIDARRLVRTNNSFTSAAVDFDATNKLIRKFFRRRHEIPVIPGFIGSTSDSKTTTLGRGGSDYTAAIFGAALDVKIIEIFTDVPGIMSADPRLVKNAVVIPRISYDEAVEIAYFGAKVIHPATILPAIQKNIPIIIRNTFDHRDRGTLISKTGIRNGRTVKVITSIDDIALVNVGGVNLFGIPGGAARVFEATAKHGVNVILISQASSEHTICFAIKENDLRSAQKGLKEEFAKEIELGLISIHTAKNQAIIAAVGDGMRGTPGVAGKLFKELGDNHINISAIAQGGSERNISCVVDSSDKIKALNLIHDSFLQQPPKHIFIAGTGNIGGALIKQIRQSAPHLKICGVINAEHMLKNDRGIDTRNWDAKLSHGEAADLRSWILWVSSVPLPNKIFVDCTASEAITNLYPEFAAKGFHIVTSNKLFNVKPYADYEKLRRIFKRTGKKFLYETNVGAALPIISTIRNLLRSGDKITRIEGVFSGTLNYIFSNFKKGKSFAGIVEEARKKGYSEPDPRKDLSGEDVRRKLLILARETGLRLDLRDIKVQSLIPRKLRSLPLEDFMVRLKEYDTQFQKLASRGELHDKMLRYVAKLEKGRGRAALEAVPMSDPVGQVRGADNVFVFYTSRYQERPLVIQGPGAGAEVTAGGVLGDILMI